MVENGSSDSPHVDEGTIHAWLDGALAADENRVVEMHVAGCEKCAAAVAEARGLIAASTRILSALDDVPGGVVPEIERAVDGLTIGASGVASSRPNRTSPARHVRRRAPIAAVAAVAAAAVAAIAIAGTLMLRGNATPVRQQVAVETPVQTSERAATQSAERTAAAAPTTPADSSASSVRAAVPSSAKHSAAQRPKVAPAATSASPAASPAPVLSRVAAAPHRQSDSANVADAADAAKAVTRSLDAGAAAPDSRFVSSFTGAGVSADVKRPRSPGTLVATGGATDSAVTGRLSQLSVSSALAEVHTAGVPQRVEGFAKSPPMMTGARVVSSNEFTSAGSRVRRTVFQVDSGATVTLTERRTLTAAENAAAENAAAENAAAENAAAENAETAATTTVRAAPLVLRGPSLQNVQSVMWISPDSTLFTLSGPLSVNELKALEARLVP